MDVNGRRRDEGKEEMGRNSKWKRQVIERRVYVTIFPSNEYFLYKHQWLSTFRILSRLYESQRNHLICSKSQSGPRGGSTHSTPPTCVA